MPPSFYFFFLKMGQSLKLLLAKQAPLLFLFSIDMIIRLYLLQDWFMHNILKT